jgi:hypothetical protein
MYWLSGALYLVLLITLGVLSLRKGHWVMFVVGLFLPLFWLTGTMLPPRRYLGSWLSTSNRAGPVCLSSFGIIPIVGIFLGLPLGVLAVVFGAIGITRVRRNLANNKGSAIAGLITGILAVVLAILSYAVIYAAVSSVNDSLNNLDSVNATSTAFPHDQKIADHREHILIDRAAFIGNW